jgi:hypothetical protein
MVKAKAASTITKKVSKKPSVAKSKTTSKPAPKMTLSREHIEESIRLKAYELYLMRLGQDGNAENDWLCAEKIVLQTQ